MGRLAWVLLLLVPACAQQSGEDIGASDNALQAGALDASFAIPQGSVAYPKRIVPLPDGGVFVVDGTYNSELKRFAKSGALLATTAPRLTPQNNFVEGWTIAALPDGNFLAGSTTHDALFRFGPSGAFDAKFGRHDGLEYVNLPRHGPSQGPADGLKALAVDSVGRTLVAGTAGKGVVARYDAEFRIDGTFGVNGAVTDDILSDYVVNVSPRNDGTVLLVCKDGFGKMRVVGLTAKGAIDTSFGNSGTIEQPWPKVPPGKMLDFIYEVSGYTVASDGTLYGVGTRRSGSGHSDAAFNDLNVPYSRELILWHWDAAGQIDPAFGNGSMAIYPVDPYETLRPRLVIDPSGAIVVAGQIEDPRRPATNVDDIAVFRFGANGAADKTFGQNGRRTFDLGGEHDQLLDVAIDSNGKIVLAGRGDSRAFVVRLLP